MKIRSIPLMIGVVIGMATGQVAADSVNDRMRTMFGAHTNATRPGVVEGTTRGVITGGGVNVRFPIKSAPTVGFDPPAISAGCGGIDLYGGNLSYPDKEQYIQMARAILGNIGGTAFRMAMTTLCPSCDSVMSDIQDMVNALNFDNMSSCQIAEQMAANVRASENPFQVFANQGRNVAAQWKVFTGRSPDAMTANDVGPGGTSPMVAAMEDPRMAEMLQGNFIWKGLQATRAADWLTSSKEGREELMSIIGTVVLCSSANGNECPVDTDNPDPGGHNFAPLLTLAEYAALDTGVNESYRVYTCAEAEECLNPRMVERNFAKTLAQQIVDVYLGDGTNKGLLERASMPGDSDEAVAMSDLERAIVANNQPLAARVFECARQGQAGMSHSRVIVEGLAPQIAAELLHTSTIQVIRELRTWVQQNNTKVGADRAAELLAEAQTRLDRDLQDVHQKAKMHDMLRISLDRCVPYAMSTHALSNY